MQLRSGTEAPAGDLTTRPNASGWRGQEAKWAGRQEIMEMLNDGRFIPYRPELIRLIFAMRHSSGGLERTE